MQDPQNSSEPVRAPGKEVKSQDTVIHSHPFKSYTSKGYYSPNMRNEPYVTKPDNSEILNLAKFLESRDLLTASLMKFDDKPENYWAWKSTFSNAIEDLDLKPFEELDLLTKWLVPESAEHAWE